MAFFSLKALKKTAQLKRDIKFSQEAYFCCMIECCPLLANKSNSLPQCHTRQNRENRDSININACGLDSHYFRVQVHFPHRGILLQMWIWPNDPLKGTQKFYLYFLYSLTFMWNFRHYSTNSHSLEFCSNNGWKAHFFMENALSIQERFLIDLKLYVISYSFRKLANDKQCSVVSRICPLYILKSTSELQLNI